MNSPLTCRESLIFLFFLRIWLHRLIIVHTKGDGPGVLRVSLILRLPWNKGHLFQSVLTVKWHHRNWNELNANIHKGLWFIHPSLFLVLQQIQQFTYSNSHIPPPTHTQTRTNNPRTFGLMSWTPRHTALYQLAVTQLVQKLPTFYGNKRFLTVFTKAHHWTLIKPLTPAHTSNPILHLHPISV